jgi:hypothetical protein
MPQKNKQHTIPQPNKTPTNKSNPTPKQVTHVQEFPGAEARYGVLDRPLAPSLQAALDAKGKYYLSVCIIWCFSIYPSVYLFFDVFFCLYNT